MLRKVIIVLIFLLIQLAVEAFAPNPLLPRLTRYSENKTTMVYPNPFKESTTVFFSSVRNETIHVKLYNSKGKILDTLFDDKVEKGEMYRFEIDARFLKPGIYYCTIESGGEIYHQRLELVK